ncbi:MAG TPA: hypothetical protein VFW83_01395 [Bryobacteraceae bacterium]|nr:hypothetical protein [Bryobacteraceae bacterium]
MESVLASRWARLLIPSLSDLFFLAVLVWLFVSSGSAGWQGLLEDADAGWHIRTGQYILAHHAVPYHDLYSFSKPGAPWYAWEWGSDVIFGLLHSLAGLKGVVLAAGAIISLFAATILLRMVWRGTNSFIALAVALLSVGAASIHFLARPHIFTMLLLSISVWMVEADRERPSRRIWLLVPLTALWANLHGGFLAIVAVLGLTAIGAAIEDRLESPLFSEWRRRGLRYAAAAAACAAASLINPYGYRLHQHIWEYLRSDWIRNVIQEFQSPSFRGESMMQFEALLLAGLIAAGALIRRKRIIEALWILFFAHEALASARHVPVFATVAGPAIAYELSRWWKAATERASKKSLVGIANQMAADAASGFRRASVWPALVVLALAFTGAPIPWPQDFPELMFPVKMVHAHPADILGKRVLTTDQWGDYLIYLNPQQKVFVDGRSDFYGPEVGNQYLHLVNGQWDWPALMKKYKFDSALLPTDLAIVQLLKIQPDWRVVKDDGKQILLVHKGAPVPLTGISHTEPRS